MAPAAPFESNNGRTSSNDSVPTLSPSARTTPPHALAPLSAGKPAAALKPSLILAAVPSRPLENRPSQNQSNAASATETKDDEGNDSQQLRYLLQRGENEPRLQALTASSTTASASPRPQEQLSVPSGVATPGARITFRDERDRVGLIVRLPS